MKHRAEIQDQVLVRPGAGAGAGQAGEGPEFGLEAWPGAAVSPVSESAQANGEGELTVDGQQGSVPPQT